MAFSSNQHCIGCSILAWLSSDCQVSQFNKNWPFFCLKIENVFNKNSNYLKSVTSKKHSKVAIISRFFSVKIWNSLRQVELLAQIRPRGFFAAGLEWFENARKNASFGVATPERLSTGSLPPLSTPPDLTPTSWRWLGCRSFAWEAWGECRRLRSTDQVCSVSSPSSDDGH